MQGNVVTRIGHLAEPVSTVEAKYRSRIDINDEDVLFPGFIAAARAYAESQTGYVMVTRGMRSTFCKWPDRIDLVWPLRKVSAITYLDSSGALQTLPPSDYVVDAAEIPGSVTRASGATWPATYDHPAAVAIDFVSGYATPFTVASNILTAKGHPFSNGESVRLSNTGGVLPAGLSDVENYYAVNVNGNTLQISLTEGGAAASASDAGTGTHFVCGPDDFAWSEINQAICLLVGHSFKNRESTTDFQQHELPMAVHTLLGHHKVWGF